ncbi:hypothetical protein AAZX31_02G121900 [Glycine max]
MASGLLTASVVTAALISFGQGHAEDIIHQSIVYRTTNFSVCSRLCHLPPPVH